MGGNSASLGRIKFKNAATAEKKENTST